MKLKPLNKIFHIQYGNQFDLYKLETDESSNINFVSRSRENLGVICKVSRYNDIEPFPAELITVTLGGSYLLSSFVQQGPFYTAQNVKVLTPLREMSWNEKIYYCKAIELNRFRYTSHGREANITLNTLLVPEEVPKEFLDMNTDYLKLAKPTSCLQESFQLHQENWKWFRYDKLFTIERGRGARVTDVTDKGQSRFITSTDQNNGLKGFVDNEPAHNGNVISVNRNGSVGEAFYQPKPFCSTEDVHVFIPKFELNQFVAMFLITLIRKERYRYSYGRKWGIARMNESLIKLPVTNNGQPDFQFMENYIKSLPYSSNLEDF